MELSPGRLASRRDTAAFVICITLAIVARTAPPNVQQSLGTVIRSTIAAPFLSLEEQVLSIKEARVSFARVVAERDSALVEAFAVRALSQENDELRSLAPLAADGLVQIDDEGTLTVSARGRLFLRNVAMAFDAYLPEQRETGRRIFSKTV